MEQQRALNALAPFIALSKSATSPRAASDLITQATSASGTYCFAELLQTSNVQNLRDSSEYAPHLKLLELFAWGTYGDYLASKEQLPQLNQAQTTKLRLLSLLTLVPSPLNTTSTTSTNPNLTYSYLQQELDLPSSAALESLVTTALTSSLLTGHTDPLHQRLAINSVAPLRDLSPHSMPTISRTLEEWQSRCDVMLNDINSRVTKIREEARIRKDREQRREKAFDKEMAKADEEHVAALQLTDNGANGRGVAQVMDLSTQGQGKGGAKRAAQAALADDVGGDTYFADVMDLDEGYGGHGSGRAGRGAKKVMGGGSRAR